MDGRRSSLERVLVQRVLSGSMAVWEALIDTEMIGDSRIEKKAMQDLSEDLGHFHEIRMGIMSRKEIFVGMA